MHLVYLPSYKCAIVSVIDYSDFSLSMYGSLLLKIGINCFHFAYFFSALYWIMLCLMLHIVHG